MNDKRFKNIEKGSTNEMLCIGNKVRLHEYNGVIYFNVSLTKEIFRAKFKSGPNGLIDYDRSEIISLSDFSNFHSIHRVQLTLNDPYNKKEDGVPIVQHYKNLSLFTPLKPNLFYVAHLQPAYYYLGNKTDFESVKKFIIKYNNNCLESIENKFDRDGLYTPGTPWYVFDGYLEEKDKVVAFTVTEDKLLKTLGVVYEGEPGFQKCLPRRFH